MSAPNLEERFLEPPGWTWGEFERDGRRIRFGSVSPENPKAIIIALPGLNEMSEKYFEIARDMLARGFAFTVIDWFGQGGSGRYLPNPHKHHGDDFAKDVEDLHHLITNHINIDAPKIMLAHSMGGNIGLRYLSEHHDIFKAAAFSAPMVGINAISMLPKPIAFGLSALLNALFGTQFTSFHGQKSFQQNQIFEGNPLTSDPERFKLMHTWMEHNPTLRCGDVTFGWVYHAIRTCAYVQEHASKIQTPCLIALAEKEEITDNVVARRTARTIQNAKILGLAGAHHEILMEQNEIRHSFFEAFDKIVQEALITSDGRLQDRPE